MTEERASNAAGLECVSVESGSGALSFWPLDAEIISIKTSDRLSDGRMAGCIGFNVLPLDDKPPATEGVYIICRRLPSGSFEALISATSLDLSRREWVSNPSWQALRDAGASHVHYFDEPSQQVRVEIVDALRSQFQHAGHCLSLELSDSAF